MGANTARGDQGKDGSASVAVAARPGLAGWPLGIKADTLHVRTLATASPSPSNPSAPACPSKAAVQSSFSKPRYGVSASFLGSSFPASFPDPLPSLLVLLPVRVRVRVRIPRATPTALPTRRGPSKRSPTTRSRRPSSAPHPHQTSRAQPGTNSSMPSWCRARAGRRL